MKRFTTYLMLVSVIALTLTTTGCKKNKGSQPEIPPTNTFEIETSDYDDSQTGPQKLNGMNTAANWTHAAWYVGIWHLVLTITMVVPVAAYHEAIHQTPQYVNDKKGWRWKFTVNVGGVDHTCKLYGKVKDNTVNWEMYLTKAGEYKNFKWYEGSSDLGNTAGNWLLYKDPKNPEKFIQIDWTRDASTGEADVKYTNVASGAGNGDYIHYGLQAGDYDAFYDINDMSDSRLLEVEWNRTDKHGHVKDEKKFGDTAWHCWDTTLHDVTCPQ